MVLPYHSYHSRGITVEFSALPWNYRIADYRVILQSTQSALNITRYPVTKTRNEPNESGVLVTIHYDKWQSSSQQRRGGTKTLCLHSTVLSVGPTPERFIEGQ